MFKLNNKSAFTLAEMMVVLLIMSIVLAAMAPIMTQRVRSQNNGIGSGSPWKWSGDNDTYLIDDSNAHTAMIGQKVLANGDGTPSLLLNSKRNDSHILFKNDGDILGRLNIKSNHGILLGRQSESGNVGESAIVIDSLDGSADGYRAVAINGTARGAGSIALGSGSIAGSESTDFSQLAIGNATSTGTYSIAIAPGDTFGRDGLSAIRTTAGYTSISIGSNAHAGHTAVAMGAGTNANGDNSIALGSGANTATDKANAIAIGRSAKSQSDSAIAIGYNSTASGSKRSIAIGYNSEASGNQGSIAIGFNKEHNNNVHQTVASGGTSVAIGAGVSSTGTDSLAIGAASGTGGSVLTATEATAMRSIAIGPAAKSAAQDSIVIGYNSYSGKISDQNPDIKSNIAIGSNLYVGEDKRENWQSYNYYVTDSISIGNSNEVTLSNSIVLGHDSKVENVVSQSSCHHSGNENILCKGDAIVLGSHAYANNLGIAIGRKSKALSNNSPAGVADIAIGYQALENTSYQILSHGDPNIAIGTRALQGAVSFGGNVAIGYEALTEAKASNTAVGYHAGRAVKGVGNTAIGYGACEYVKGSRKTCIGAHSGPSSGDSLAAEDDSNNVIFLGTSNTTVYIPGNLVVGKDVILNASSVGSSQDGHGYATVVRPFNKNGFTAIRTENADGGDDNLRYYNNGMIHESDRQSWFNNWMTSDRRLKNVGKEFTSGLDKIKQLKVFNYTFKKDENKTPRVGVMAQDLQKVFPDAISKDDKGFLMIRFEDMFYAIINAIKELDAKITALVQDNFRQDKILNQVQDDYKRIKDDNARLKKENAELKARLDKLEAKLK